MLDLKWNVTSNVREFVKYLDNAQKKQVPFATARGLTWTAKAAQKDLQEAMPETFKVTRKWWLEQQPTGIKVKPAKKAELQADVYTRAYFAFLQEEGGIKLPFRGRGILIPTPITPKYGRRSGGAVKVMAGKKSCAGGARPTATRSLPWNLGSEAFGDVRAKSVAIWNYCTRMCRGPKFDRICNSKPAPTKRPLNRLTTGFQNHWPPP